MKKRLLLVDDERLLLETLRDGLAGLEHLFETDICFSVDGAIPLLEKNRYNLIITDIRMPGKSGIDLMIHLKSIRYSGQIMAMTAYGNEEMFSKIWNLGGMNIITKPFDFDWFKGMIVDFFSEKEGFSGTIRSIDLTSILQIINLEKKTVRVKIIINGRTGFIYFQEGEIVHAEYDGLSGEKAALKLISLNKGEFSVLDSLTKPQATIDIPFMTFMMNIMKEIDERRLLEGEGADAEAEKESLVKPGISETILECFNAVDGLKRFAILDFSGEHLLASTGAGFEENNLSRELTAIYRDYRNKLSSESISNLTNMVFNGSNGSIVFFELNPGEIYFIGQLSNPGRVHLLLSVLAELAGDMDRYLYNEN